MRASLAGDACDPVFPAQPVVGLPVAAKLAYNVAGGTAGLTTLPFDFCAGMPLTAARMKPFRVLGSTRAVPAAVSTAATEPSAVTAWVLALRHTIVPTVDP